MQAVDRSEVGACLDLGHPTFHQAGPTPQTPKAPLLIPAYLRIPMAVGGESDVCNWAEVQGHTSLPPHLTRCIDLSAF